MVCGGAGVQAGGVDPADVLRRSWRASGLPVALGWRGWQVAAMNRLWIALLLLASAPGRAEMPAPVMTPLSTGSTLAVWTLAADPNAGTRHVVPVVFLHGGPGMYTEERRLAEAAVLRAAGFDTVFFDQAGGGRSARLPATEYSLARAVDDIEAQRIALRVEKLVLWGNSYGAVLAALYAGRFPGRVAGVLLTSPGMFPGYAGSRDYGRTQRNRVEYSREIRAAVDATDKRGAAAEASLPQAAAGQLFDTLVGSELADGMVCKDSPVASPPPPGGGNLYAQRLISRDLRALKVAPAPLPGVPALVIRGACDFLPMASADRYRALFGAGITEIPDAGHGLLENRTAVDAAIAAFARGALADVE